jgi:hypothetical protein
MLSTARIADPGCTVTANCYEIRVRGRLTNALASELRELDLQSTVEPVETLLHGPVADQAALYGLLRRIESLGLELVEVRRVPETHERPAP